ncbi:DUF6415 family natural product biosynthesis protein [Streptomyces sp. NPDC096032]|uniref:DUF6415 family natural product biosynthesis protein n=1 Tax=Streptomyces sp. NPDC096032 TaxID=3366070 RepID=UPI0037FF892D
MTRAACSTDNRVDIAAMRRTAAKLLGPDDGPDALPPAPAELETLTAELRSHLERLIPEVEGAARREPADSGPKFCALACVGEAQRKLHAGDGTSWAVRVAMARKLARSVNALCEHHEKLGARTPEGERP